jgi:hypothetical protein
VRRLLLAVLFIGAIGFIGVAAGCATRQVPKPEAERRVLPGPATFNPHLDVPRNCLQTQNVDGSVLMTCECENCGHPEARDGMDPTPWSCVLRDQGLFCGYGNRSNDVNVSAGRDVTTLEYPVSGSCKPRFAKCSTAAYVPLGIEG